jgi:small neutral amino acid transporter SnatA (MarC family)
MSERDNRQRDIATLRVLGTFFSIMGALVLIAIYETIGNRPAMIVNVLSGLALVAVGIAMIQISRRMSRSDDDG